MENGLLPVPCLLIDDRTDYIESFTQKAEKFGIKVDNRTNFEDMKDFLRSSGANSISCIILDIQCLLTRDEESISTEFIGKATKYLGAKYPNLKIFIITAESGRREEWQKFQKEYEIFIKTPEDEDNLLDKVKKLTLELELNDIKVRYEEIFNIIEDENCKLNEEYNIIKEILLCHNSASEAQILAQLGQIRVVSSKILDHLINEFEQLAPEPEKKFWDGKIKHLKGNPKPTHPFKPGTEVFITPPISSLLTSIYKITSEYGNHLPNSEVLYRPTNYTLKACTNMLCELILWYHDFSNKLRNQKMN